MASSNEGGGSQTEPPPTKNVTDPTPPPPSTTYPTYPPPAPAYPTCYPPPGYPPVPGNQNPHTYPQGYALYTNGNPYPYPPTAPYYVPSATNQLSGPSAATRFYRSFILCSCILLTCLFFASLVVALVFRPDLPVYRAVSVSVTNFTTTPSLFGEWDTKIMIDNPNHKLRAFFSKFRVDIMYKDGVVAVTHAPGFVLHENEAREVDGKGLSNGAMMETTTLDDMRKERNSTGSLTFALRVSSMNAFRSGSVLTKEIEEVAICEGLKIVFQNNSSNGMIDNGGKPIECHVYV